MHIIEECLLLCRGKRGGFRTIGPQFTRRAPVWVTVGLRDGLEMGMGLWLVGYY